MISQRRNKFLPGVWWSLSTSVDWWASGLVRHAVCCRVWLLADRVVAGCALNLHQTRCAGTIMAVHRNLHGDVVGITLRVTGRAGARDIVRGARGCCVLPSHQGLVLTPLVPTPDVSPGTHATLRAQLRCHACV